MPVQNCVWTLNCLCIKRISLLVMELSKELSRCKSISLENKCVADQKLLETESNQEESENSLIEESNHCQNDTQTTGNSHLPEHESPENGDCDVDEAEQSAKPEDCSQVLPPPGEIEPRQRREKLEAAYSDLGQVLTTHSHATLHSTLFKTITYCLDPTYKKEKSIHRAMQNLLIHFINSTLRELDFEERTMFSEADMCKVLFENLHHATNLEKLVIGRSCYWKSKIFENLNMKLTSLPHLTVLKVEYICTPEMINKLSENCPKLCELSLKGSERITDKDSDEIAKCRKLITLDISGTRITGRGCWKILDSVKSLLWLHHCAFNCNSDSLLFESRADLFDYVKKQLRGRESEVSLMPRLDLNPGNAKFNLKNFWLFNPVTKDLLMTCLCPDLEQLRLEFIFQDLEEEPDPSILSSLTQLKKLEVIFSDRCAFDLARMMLEACGERLTSLSLHLVDDWFMVAPVHNVVASCCPNLVSLSFSGDYKARHTLEDCDHQLDFTIPLPAHPRLQSLKVTGVVSDQRLSFLLNHAPALRTLCLDGELEWLHDAMFASILLTNPLPNLEMLWFNVSTTVTLATVRLMLRQDNPLRSMGRLCHMGGATMGEYQELLAQVHQNNLDIKLIWVTDERKKK